jgi:hypothetical protein
MHEPRFDRKDLGLVFLVLLLGGSTCVSWFVWVAVRWAQAMGGFDRKYRSGEVARLHMYDDDNLARDLLPCERVGGGGRLRRDVAGKRLFVRTGLTNGPACTGSLREYLLVFEKGAATRRQPVGADELVSDDGKVVEVSGDRFGVERDQSGAEYIYVRRRTGLEVMAMHSPERVLARSALEGGYPRLFSKGHRHFVCGWLHNVGSGEGACDVFESVSADAEWRSAGRLTFGNHRVVDMDPGSDSVLVETPRDDLDPLLFTVELKTWHWRYIGAGPSWSLLFMSVDPLGRPSKRN